MVYFFFCFCNIPLQHERIVIIIIVIIVTFRQGIYNYIPETNHVSSVHSDAAFLKLQFMAHVMVFPMTNVLYFT